VGEALVQDHGHQQLLHAGQGPGPLEQGEGQGGQREAAAGFLQRGGETGEALRIARVGEAVAFQGSRSDLAVADRADVRVDPPVPLHAELVLPDPRPTGKLAFGQAGAQHGQAVVQGGLEARIPVVGRQPLARGAVKVR